MSDLTKQLLDLAMGAIKMQQRVIDSLQQELEDTRDQLTATEDALSNALGIAISRT